MQSNMVYVPLSEETISFIERLNPKQVDIDSFLNDVLSEKIFYLDVQKMQEHKMKELWDNEYDESWNNI